MKKQPAFPCAFRHGTEEEGMSMREYYAAKAMQSLLSSIEGNDMFSAKNIARDSFSMADAMIVESQKIHDEENEICECESTDPNSTEQTGIDMCESCKKKYQ